jgi:CheY-like chemotaxis protein
MPGTDGYQMIRELRLRPPTQGGSVPALALSAYARTEDRLRALRAGFQLHLAKPVQPSELVTVVASLAARPEPPSPR